MDKSNIIQSSNMTQEKVQEKLNELFGGSNSEYVIDNDTAWVE